jgi:hypothetical protein
VWATFDHPVLTFPGGAVLDSSTLTVSGPPGVAIADTPIVVQASGGPFVATVGLHLHGLCPAPFDLVSTRVDDNGILLNPVWGQQVAQPGTFPNAEAQCAGFPTLPTADQITFGSPPCTTQAGDVTHDFAAHDNGVYAFSCTTALVGDVRPPHDFSQYHGHVNWYPATYEGLLHWESHSNSVYNDDDYGLDLTTPGGAGRTIQDTAGLHIEFVAGETINHFHTPWWSAFHSAVDSGDIPAGSMVNGHFAIVTGLIGLDAAHPIGAESHPVWALAISANAHPDPANDVWALFARNWGSEGYCSSRNYHLLGLTTYTFRLPWWPGATAVSVGPGTQFLGRFPFSYTVSVVPQEGVLVSFTLGNPSDLPRINGELHLRWSGATLAADPNWFSTAVAGTPGRLAPESIAVRPHPRPEMEEALARLTRNMLATMTPAQRARFLRLAGQPPGSSGGFDSIVRGAVTARRMAAFPTPALPRPRTTVLRNGVTKAMQRRLEHGFCAGLFGPQSRLPGAVRRFCRSRR